MERTVSTIEKMLGGEFSGDPRCSRFPLPEIPEGAPVTPGVSYTVSGVVITPAMAKDWILHRSIRRDVMPRELMHDDICPNRKYLVSYAKQGAKKLEDDSGWWERGTHQGAAFTEDGFLLDSQHRFAWSALSGVDITMPVARNVPWSAWETIDQNRRRNAAQMLDIPYSTAAASVARHLIPVLDGESATRHKVIGNDFTEQIVEICLGWPYFAEDQSWMREIYEAAGESGVPSGPLGAVCIGALAGGAPADEVQQFLNGLRPLTRNVQYIAIGTNGSDPRNLAARHFRKLRDARGPKGRLSAPEERAATGTIRHAMDVWLRRHAENPKKIKILQRWAESNDLPSLWNEDAICAFHEKFVN